MSFSYLGGQSIGSAFPMFATAQADLAANVNLTLPDINAKLAAAIQASISITPPTLDVLAQLQAAISLGLPSVTIDLTAIGQIILELQGIVLQLNAQLAFAVALGGALGAGIHLYRWSGPASDVIPGGVPGLPAETSVDGVFLVAGTSGASQALDFLMGL